MSAPSSSSSPPATKARRPSFILQSLGRSNSSTSTSSSSSVASSSPSKTELAAFRAQERDKERHKLARGLLVKRDVKGMQPKKAGGLWGDSKDVFAARELPVFVRRISVGDLQVVVTPPEETELPPSVIFPVASPPRPTGAIRAPLSARSRHAPAPRRRSSASSPSPSPVPKISIPPVPTARSREEDLADVPPVLGASESLKSLETSSSSEDEMEQGPPHVVDRPDSPSPQPLTTKSIPPPITVVSRPEPAQTLRHQASAASIGSLSSVESEVSTIEDAVVMTAVVSSSPTSARTLRDTSPPLFDEETSRFDRSQRQRTTSGESSDTVVGPPPARAERPTLKHMPASDSFPEVVKVLSPKFPTPPPSPSATLFEALADTAPCESEPTALKAAPPAALPANPPLQVHAPSPVKPEKRKSLKQKMSLGSLSQASNAAAAAASSAPGTSAAEPRLLRKRSRSIARFFFSSSASDDAPPPLPQQPVSSATVASAATTDISPSTPHRPTPAPPLYTPPSSGMAEPSPPPALRSAATISGRKRSTTVSTSVSRTAAPVSAPSLLSSPVKANSRPATDGEVRSREPKLEKRFSVASLSGMFSGSVRAKKKGSSSSSIIPEPVPDLPSQFKKPATMPADEDASDTTTIESAASPRTMSASPESDVFAFRREESADVDSIHLSTDGVTSASVAMASLMSSPSINSVKTTGTSIRAIATRRGSQSTVGSFDVGETSRTSTDATRTQDDLDFGSPKSVKMERVAAQTSFSMMNDDVEFEAPSMTRGPSAASATSSGLSSLPNSPGIYSPPGAPSVFASYQSPTTHQMYSSPVAKSSDPSTNPSTATPFSSPANYASSRQHHAEAIPPPASFDSMALRLKLRSLHFAPLDFGDIFDPSGSQEFSVQIGDVGGTIVEQDASSHRHNDGMPGGMAF